jgi:hypothetical protein
LKVVSVSVGSPTTTRNGLNIATPINKQRTWGTTFVFWSAGSPLPSISSILELARAACDGSICVEGGSTVITPSQRLHRTHTWDAPFIIWLALHAT